MTEELQGKVLDALREHGDVEPHLAGILPNGEWTVLVNAGAGEVHVKEGHFEGGETPFVKVYHVRTTDKPQLDHDNNGKAGGSLPKTVKRKPARK